MKHRSISIYGIAASLALSLAGVFTATDGRAEATICPNGGRTVTANVVVIDQPLMFNRLGAANVNGMIYALKRDVIDGDGRPLTDPNANPDPTQQNVLQLRPDRRPRPLVLRVAAGDCLTVVLENRLTPGSNPNNMPVMAGTGLEFTIPLDEQPLNRWVGFHAAGMQMVTGIYDDGSIVGDNPVLENPTSHEGGLVSPGNRTAYNLYAEKEGVFLVTSEGVLIGSDGNEGHISNGLFGQVIVEPKGARIFRGQVHEEELRLALDTTNTNSCTTPSTPGYTCDGHPIINYEATYPNTAPWTLEGKAGLPVLNMISAANEVVHSEINAVVAGPDADGTWKSKCPGTDCPYPLESVGKRNPSLPNRLEPFRDFSSQFHDETANAQAFPGFYVADPVFRYVLEGVKDAFMINYGSGGIGSEIIANRLGVGPMHDCLTCAYEEFFLTSYTVGDPAMLVDVPANLGLENLMPADLPKLATCGTATPAPECAALGPKATFAIGAEDPANIHHSYTGDFTKIRNTHAGKEQHVFHLHNHQWLYNPNDDNSNYLDAQGIGPGAGYTYEINFGGSGNRNKSAGDAIFHCHFYPHFAQGMWYHWRHHDVTETGTVLAASGGTAAVPSFHTVRWALANTTPAPGARALPDPEIVTGTPIPAVVPLPGKPMAPMPAPGVTVKANPLTKTASAFHPASIAAGAPVTVPVGSLANIPRDASGKLTIATNPGYPFWVAGIEDIVGQRPPTPPLDMLDADKAKALKDSGNPLWSKIEPAQADGFDGGLPRHSLQGYAAGGSDKPADGGINVVTARDFSKKIGKAKAVYFPEEGTDLEQLAMAFHAVREHSSWATDLNGTVVSAKFVTNGGGGPVVGAPFHNPCVDDLGHPMEGTYLGEFFDGTGGTTTRGGSVFTSDKPRIYKGTFLQFDAVLNKVGYHYPQQRIVALWQDAGPIIAKQKPPEPMVFRFNTFDCMVYHNSNLVPEAYEMDDYQVRTPTDIIGQHIHLPKWDLTTTDGSANGWNYEDGTLSPGTVRERIEAINRYTRGHAWGTGSGTRPLPGTLTAGTHPYFASVAAALDGAPVGKLAARETFAHAWLGARTTIQRWFADPVVNVAGVDRGLGIIFTHDHYGPSTHQQIGLYSTALTEPAGSTWFHNETGRQLACTAPGARPGTKPPASLAPNTTPCRWDGGPTSWQAAVEPSKAAPAGTTVKSETIEPYREFYFEYSDFQHAYEAGVYAGANQMGLPLLGTAPGNPTMTVDREVGGKLNPADGFRYAINPPARLQIAPVFPDLYREVASTVGQPVNFCPQRPCPQAIDVQDPGVLVVNYRHEPIGLRIYDPNKTGPDGKKGMQADGERGDLAFALQSRTDRVITQLNVMPTGATAINGTKFPPHINTGGFNAGDPFTPMIRTYPGDVVRVKMQAGGHEEEHNATIFGMKWLQAGSGHGRAPNSGWRNAQAGGISEQFTLTTPVLPSQTVAANTDYAYSMDSGNDGWWSGMWGIFRAHNKQTVGSLYTLSNAAAGAPAATNFGATGICPQGAPLKTFNVTAVLANQALKNALGATIPTPATTTAGTLQNLTATQHVGGPLNNLGGTLVYNHRKTSVSGVGIDPITGTANAIAHNNGLIHDPTAILYVRTEDLTAGVLNDSVAVEPLVLRANAGDCIDVNLTNSLPALKAVQNVGNNSTAPDLATYSMILGVVKRDRLAAAGSTTFNVNLFRPSSWVGLTPQLVALDQGTDAGILVGTNQKNNLVVPKGKSVKYRWYAGDVSFVRDSTTAGHLVWTPVEFGGSSLMPSDKVKQGAKGLVGALVIEPAGTTWTDSTPVFDHQTVTGTRASRAQVTVKEAGGAALFRDFSLVLTKGTTQYYGDGTPVEHMNGEGAGIPEDSQEASGMSLNYGVEPLWFRFGILPQAPFGGAGCGAGCYGTIPDAHKAYSNRLPDTTGEVGDPATPVFQANAGQPARIRITNPHGTTRGSTFGLHGHVWQRDPYVCDDNQYGLPGKCDAPATGALTFGGVPLVGSRAIGKNPLGLAQGGQESFNAPAHFDILLPYAGGINEHPGDYLFRDKASFGSASGVWGILRVNPPGTVN